MKMSDGQTKYLASFIDELSKSGVKHAVICPGSRSTPLAYLIAEHPNMKEFILIDERSAAFFALGLAKATNEPVVLLCTSGTAAANFYPAIIEAFYSRVPLIVLTADRPHELRDVGAPQAIDQIHLYGKHVKWFNEMAVPEDSELMIKYTRTVSSRAVNTSVQSPQGPVHINIPLREPLLPNLQLEQLYESNHSSLNIHHPNGKLTLSTSEWTSLSKTLPEKGIIICGVIDSKPFRDAVMELSQHLKYPILADPLSQLRCVETNEDQIIDCYDTFLRNSDAVHYFKPELMIRFGGMPVSKPLLKFISHYKDVPQLVVDNSFGWRRDPSGTASSVIYCDEEIFSYELKKHSTKRDSSNWFDSWTMLNRKVRDLLTTINDETEMNEGKIVFRLNKTLPDQSCLFVGNSMPIRDVDTFFHNTKKHIRIMANRGVNGIDGIISTALGVSVMERQNYLLLGDLSFYHDLNGLLAAKLYKLPLTIIVVNNNGGGIFSFLPQKGEPNHFELLFGTPTHLTFEYAVKLYEGEYRKVDSWEQFDLAIQESGNHQGLFVIEVFTDREKNRISHQQLWSYISKEVSNTLKDW